MRVVHGARVKDTSRDTQRRVLPVPSIDDNRYAWTVFDWAHAGDEWSGMWNGSEMLWWGTILPRIHAFVPTGTILEIAPGYGRMTHYLKDLCDHLIVVDLTERCIDACKQRFADASHITYHVNDGKSLDMLATHSVDFAFSFDSLVHVEADVMEAYITQLARILTPNGVAWLHHSNAAACLDTGDAAARTVVEQMWRGQSVSAALCATYAAHAGLACIGQEVINWGSALPVPLDGFSLLTPQGSTWDRPPIVIRNDDFSAEAHHLAILARLYARASFGRQTRSDGAANNVGAPERCEP